MEVCCSTVLCCSIVLRYTVQYCRSIGRNTKSGRRVLCLRGVRVQLDRGEVRRVVYTVSE